MMNWLMISFLLSIISYISANQESKVSYCNVETCSYNIHTMCKYKSQDYSKSCGDRRYIWSGLTTKEKGQLLKAHNDLRHFVASGKEKRGNPGPQPPAKNLTSLIWDDELATIAQRWANQCVPRHDQCRDIDKYKVGQNIAFRGTSTEYPNNLTSIVLQWYDEVQYCNKDLVEKFLVKNQPQILHYTQMMWAETKHVGCGCIKYKKENYWYTTHLVCNYGPGGNMIGEPIYEVY